MVTIHLIGDSLVTAYGSDEENILGGWGDHLGCYYDEKEFVTFTKDEEAINVYFVKDGIKVADILMGVAATIKIIMEETGKDKETVLKVVNEMIDEANKK